LQFCCRSARQPTPPRLRSDAPIQVAGKWLFVASNNYDTTLIVTSTEQTQWTGDHPADEA